MTQIRKGRLGSSFLLHDTVADWRAEAPIRRLIGTTTTGRSFYRDIAEKRIYLIPFLWSIFPMLRPAITLRYSYRTPNPLVTPGPPSFELSYYRVSNPIHSLFTLEICSMDTKREYQGSWRDFGGREQISQPMSEIQLAPMRIAKLFRVH